MQNHTPNLVNEIEAYGICYFTLPDIYMALFFHSEPSVDTSCSRVAWQFLRN